MKIQTKTAILFTVLTAGILLVWNITMYIFINSSAHQDFNKRLELRARLAAKYKFEQDKLSTKAFAEIQKEYMETLPKEEVLFIPVKGTAGVVVLPQGIPADMIKETVEANGGTVFYQQQFRHYAAILYHDVSGDFVVIKSATNEYGMSMMRKLRNMKIASFIFAIVLIYSLGIYFSRKTFQPIRNIIQSAKEISKGNLHLRLAERKGGDEIAELTSTFNEMLNRLQTAFEAQNNFISHASHELRTPLTAIIGEADYALSKERAINDYRYSLSQISQQAEKLQILSKGLLGLAKTGFDGKTQSWSLIRIDQLVFDLLEDCKAITPEINIQLEMGQLPDDEEKISVMGNYDLLKTAITNIVLNACKYSGNQPVHVRLTVEPEGVNIEVADKGIGIPRNEIKYIYEPFFRASNTKDFEGFGIGMPLSNNIIRLHKGSIEVNSEEGKGTLVSVFLPIVQDTV